MVQRSPMMSSARHGTILRGTQLHGGGCDFACLRMSRDSGRKLARLVPRMEGERLASKITQPNTLFLLMILERAKGIEPLDTQLGSSPANDHAAADAGSSFRDILSSLTRCVDHISRAARFSAS
jgi:hypothetical protein